MLKIKFACSLNEKRRKIKLLESEFQQLKSHLYGLNRQKALFSQFQNPHSINFQARGDPPIPIVR